MSIIGAFTGADQQADITAAKGKADAALAAGNTAEQAGYGHAIDQFAPYSQTGTRANAMYANATGVNGQPAHDAAAKGFATGDPFRQQNEDYANEQLKRTFAARGGTYSGNAMLAAARGSLERGSTDWNNWLNRLQGQAGQGFAAAGSTANLMAGQGNAAMGYGQTVAGNEINYGNAMASHENDAFTNTISGLNAAGNVIGAVTGMPRGGNSMGVNNLSRQPYPQQPGYPYSGVSTRQS